MIANLKKHGLLYTSLLFILISAAFAIQRFADNDGGMKVIKPSPSFSLRDMNGSMVQSSDLKGSVVLLAFIFTTCPDICPITTSKMVMLQEELKRQGLFGKQVRFVSVTIDPTQDTPEALKDYAQKMGADPSGWSFVRGEEQDIQRLASRFGYMVQNLGDGQFVHTVTSLTLIDGEQRVRDVYKMGDDMNNDEVLSGIKALVADLKSKPAAS